MLAYRLTLGAFGAFLFALAFLTACAIPQAIIESAWAPPLMRTVALGAIAAAAVGGLMMGPAFIALAINAKRLP